MKRNGKVCDSLGKKAKKQKGVLEVLKNIQYYFSEYKADISSATIQEPYLLELQGKNKTS